MAKLIVLGSINVDHIIQLAQFPQAGETVIGKNYQLAFGGKGANQAVAAARSGADTAFIACVGDDEMGLTYRQQLQREGIDISAVQIIANCPTGVALIFVNQAGENSIAIHGGANAQLTIERLTPYQQMISQAQWLLMQLETPLATVLAAAQWAKQQGKRVMLNPAPACQLPNELLTCVDLLTPNESEAEYLTGVKVVDAQSAEQAAAILHAKGVDTVIITLGAKGVWLSQSAQAGQLISGFTVKAVDTIAAGDTFSGALITALLEQQTLTQAIRFAQAASAIAVTRAGAQPAIPQRQEIMQFLAQH